MLMDQGLLERQDGAWVVTTDLEELRCPPRSRRSSRRGSTA